MIFGNFRGNIRDFVLPLLPLLPLLHLFRLFNKKNLLQGKLPLTGIVVTRLEDTDTIKNAFEIDGPLIEKITAVCQGPNEANKWVELLSPDPIASFKPKSNESLKNMSNSPLSSPIHVSITSINTYPIQNSHILFIIIAKHKMVKTYLSIHKNSIAKKIRKSICSISVVIVRERHCAFIVSVCQTTK